MKKLITCLSFFISINIFSQAIPYSESIPLNDEYYSKIKYLLNIHKGTLNGYDYELFKEQESTEDGPEWNYSAILRIGRQYFPIQLGIGHSIEVADISNNDSIQELIIKSGCFSDAGCLETVSIIQQNENLSFSYTNFGEVVLSSEYEILDLLDEQYQKVEFDKDFSEIKKVGEFLIMEFFYDENNGSCYKIFNSVKKLPKGFEKGFFTKKISVVCAG
jgi:hypothetical protein